MEKKRVFKMAIMALLLFAFTAIPMVAKAGDAKKGEEIVHGRPVDVAVLPDGSILVSDDSAKTIFQIKAIKD